MNANHREVLRKNRLFLVKELMVDGLWPSLVNHGVFTEDMLDHIKVTGARSSQVQRLLSDLPRRGPRALDKFLVCLDESDQSHIADHLRDAVAVVNEREPSFELRQTCSDPQRARAVQPATLHPAITGPVTLYPADREASRRELRASHLSLTSDDFHSLYARPVCEAYRPAVSDSISADFMTASVMAAPMLSRNVCGRGTLANASSTCFKDQPDHGESRSPLLTTSLDQAEPASGTQRQCLVQLSCGMNCSPVSGALGIGMTYSSLSGASSIPEESGGSHVAHGSDGKDVADGPCSTNEDVTNDRSKATSKQVVDGAVGTSGQEKSDGPFAVDSCLPESTMQLSTRLEPPATKASSMGDLNFNGNKVYRMASNPRGYCVIINNRFFTGHLSERVGTDVDKNNLYRLFSQLGYMISIKENLSAMDMLVTLKDFAELGIHANVDSCAVILLTHGLDGQIYGSDCQLIDLHEVFAFFDGQHCPALKGKPKVIVVQACRGEMYDSGFEATDSPGVDTVGPQYVRQQTQSADFWTRKLPSSSDFLIAYATIPGHVSWRNSDQGSWFVQALCDVFSKNAYQDDATSMLVEVNDRVATAYESATNHKQMPAPVVLLRKKLYFHPLCRTL